MGGIDYRPSLADLKLQIVLYYNAIFSFMFSVLVGSCSIQKVQISKSIFILVQPKMVFSNT